MDFYRAVLRIIHCFIPYSTSSSLKHRKWSKTHVKSRNKVERLMTSLPGQPWVRSRNMLSSTGSQLSSTPPKCPNKSRTFSSLVNTEPWQTCTANSRQFFCFLFAGNIFDLWLTINNSQGHFRCFLHLRSLCNSIVSATTRLLGEPTAHIGFKSTERESPKINNLEAHLKLFAPSQHFAIISPLLLKLVLKYKLSNEPSSPKSYHC